MRTYDYLSIRSILPFHFLLHACNYIYIALQKIAARNWRTIEIYTFGMLFRKCMRANIVLVLPGIILFLVILPEKTMAAWTFTQDVQQLRWYSICSCQRSFLSKLENLDKFWNYQYLLIYTYVSRDNCMLFHIMYLIYLISCDEKHSHAQIKRLHAL